MAKGLLSKPDKGGHKKGKDGGGSNYLSFLPQAQRRTINQRNKSDFALGKSANALLPQIDQAYSQPFDWNSLPSSPVSGDYSKWRDDQLQSGLSEYDKLNTPRLTGMRDDFEQQMANRGIPMGSDLYNKQKNEMEQQLSSERNQAFENIKATAAQSAEGWFNIGTTAHGNALNEGMMKRNQPLNEYSALYGAQSQMPMANLGYAQQHQSQQEQEANQRWLLQHTPHGGGGGGAGETWQQYGFSSPQEYDAYQRQQNQQDLAWNWANNPQYKQSGQVNPYVQAGGSLLGAFAGGFGQSLGKGIFSSS